MSVGHEITNIHVCNHVKLGFFSKCTVLCDGCWLMGLADLWGIADLHCQTVETVPCLNKPMADLGFLFLRGSLGGQLEFVTQAFDYLFD